MSEPTGTDPIREALQTRLGGQYAVEGLLGQGGMGSVYRARDITLDRPVAIKVISGDVATNPQLRDRFLLEARTVAKLRHPNIVAVYTAGDAGGLLYFVMELVPGESLRDLLTREGKVEPARAERILHELALALDYAHSNGIVHRDVKPENILLDRETGRAMLTDFGVARALEGDGRMTGTGMILGSPRYMSPEQATGESTIDGRSDLYALALVGYETFTGKPVVDASNVAGMLVKHLTETPKPLAQAAASVPEGVATAIDRALMKDKEQRWKSGREMAEVIGMAWTPAGGSSGSGMRTAIGGLGARGTASGKGAASKGRSLVIGGVAVAALVATAWAMLGGSGVPSGVDPRRSYAVMPFEVQSGNADIKWLRDGAVNMLTLALAQWKDLDVADYERTMVLVRDAGLEEKRVDLDKALEIARRANAWTVVTGTITTTSDSLRVDARLYDVASGKSLQTESRTAALNTDPRPLFDGLARYLIGVAGVTGSESVDLAAATTNSLVAYRAYLEGVRALFSWQVLRADSLFQIAIRNDSTFALAWHKRSLALGWGDATGATYLESAARALALVDRLPKREQALVRGHYALSRGLRASTTGGGTGTKELQEAEEIYRTLIESDSSVAEAWYGYGDALFHTPFDPKDFNGSTGRMTASMRAFHRTLALDSTFHLAYSHLIQQYQLFTGQQGLLLVGDTVQVVADSNDLRRVGGTARVLALRDTALARGFALTRGWVKADPDAVPAVAMLAQGYMQAGKADSAISFLDEALKRPALARSPLRFVAGTYQMAADNPRGIKTLLDATRELSPAEMRGQIPTSDRFTIIASAVTAAGMSGSMAEVERTADYFVKTDSVLPFGSTPTRPLLNGFKLGLAGAMRGSLTSAERTELLAGLRRVEGSNDAALAQLRQGMVPLAYVAFMLTGDTAFSAVVKRSLGTSPQPDLEARLALLRGDTAEARRIAGTFTSADSVRLARLGLAGLRTVMRAEVLEVLGDKRGAIAQYEAMHPSRFVNGFIDPGYAVYVRTFAARARLYEQVGERDKAIAAWQDFLRRWEKGDSITEPARTEARAALQRLRDSAPRR